MAVVEGCPKGFGQNKTVTLKKGGHQKTKKNCHNGEKVRHQGSSFLKICPNIDDTI